MPAVQETESPDQAKRHAGQLQGLRGIHRLLVGILYFADAENG